MASKGGDLFVPLAEAVPTPARGQATAPPRVPQAPTV